MCKQCRLLVAMKTRVTSQALCEPAPRPSHLADWLDAAGRVVGASRISRSPTESSERLAKNSKRRFARRVVSGVMRPSVGSLALMLKSMATAVGALASPPRAGRRGRDRDLRASRVSLLPLGCEALLCTCHTRSKHFEV